MTADKEPPITIRLLGSFEVRQGDRIIVETDWPRKKAAALLKRLAYERRLIKDQAIDFLWPDSNIASGSNNLYKAIYSLRQTLDKFLGPGTADKIFSFEDGILRLNDNVWVDAAEFEQLCETAPGEPPDQRTARLEEALKLYQGDFLPDERYEDWTLLPRESLIRLHREAALILAKHHLEQRDFPFVIGLLPPLLHHDPADELVHRELMRAYTLAGRRHDALRQYQACVEALESELGTRPGAETTVLYEQILSGGLAPLPEPGPSNAWSPPVPVSFDPDRTGIFTGRLPELKTLSDFLLAARQNHGVTVFIAGESGIGKTRLAMEVLRLAVEAGMTALLGAAFEQEGRLPFQPFIEAFDHFLAEKGLSLQENPITHFHSLGSPDPQQEHWALFKATANFVLDIARESPLVFLVDDLHAADETSLQLFHYLVRQTRSAPVAFIATYRLDSPISTQFNALKSALYREGLSETITLEPLSEEAVREILEDVFEGEVSNELYRAVHEATAGNPFFAQEVAYSLLRLGKVNQVENRWMLKSGEELSVPGNLSALLRQRVSRLGRNVEVTLTAAAVIGQEFSFEVLRDSAALSSGEILDALDSALTAHLIEETPVGYRFRHPLIRRALYESLSRARRASQHTRTAEAVEAINAKRTSSRVKQVEALAYHYDLSDRRERALPYMIQAGENAAGVYAFEVAVDYFERALSLLDDLGMSDTARRWHLLESLGRWHGILADTPSAVVRFEQALNLHPESAWQPTSRDLVRLHCLAAVALITAGNMNAAENHLQSALDTVDERENAPEYADLLYNLAQLHWHRNEYQQAMERAQRSLEIAERLDQPDAIARAFEMLALACHSLGEWQAGIAYEQKRAELAGSELDVTDAFDVHL